VEGDPGRLGVAKAVPDDVDPVTGASPGRADRLDDGRSALTGHGVGGTSEPAERVHDPGQARAPEDLLEVDLEEREPGPEQREVDTVAPAAQQPVAQRRVLAVQSEPDPQGDIGFPAAEVGAAEQDGRGHGDGLPGIPGA
jgi:hypothetical protein